MVLALTSAGAEKWRSAIIAAVLKATGCARIYERSDSEVRGLEGLAPAAGVLHGPPIDGALLITEHGVRLELDVLLGFRPLNPGGLLMSYSCSGGVGLELFQKIVAGAASDAGVDARILRRLGASADHPVGLAFLQRANT